MRSACNPTPPGWSPRAGSGKTQAGRACLAHQGFSFHPSANPMLKVQIANERGFARSIVFD